MAQEDAISPMLAVPRARLKSTMAEYINASVSMPVKKYTRPLKGSTPMKKPA